MLLLFLGVIIGIWRPLTIPLFFHLPGILHPNQNRPLCSCGWKTTSRNRPTDFSMIYRPFSTKAAFRYFLSCRSLIYAIGTRLEMLIEIAWMPPSKREKALRRPATGQFSWKATLNQRY